MQEENLGKLSHLGLLLGFYAMPSNTSIIEKVLSEQKQRHPASKPGPRSFMLCICMWQMQFLRRCKGWSPSPPGREPPGSWCWTQARCLHQQSLKLPGEAGVPALLLLLLKAVSQVVSNVTASSSWETLRNQLGFLSWEGEETKAG